MELAQNRAQNNELDIGAVEQSREEAIDRNTTSRHSVETSPNSFMHLIKL
jgi:hypothetical protein